MSQSSSSSNTSGMILVHLDFHDGSKCKMWLEPHIVNRLQEGDDKLMEELRQQYIQTVAPPEETVAVKQPLTPTSLDVTTPDVVSTGDLDKLEKLDDVTVNTSMTTAEDEDATTYYITADTAIANNTTVPPEESISIININGNLVEVLNSVDSLPNSYLEDLQESNYVEINGSTYQLDNGEVINEDGQIVIKYEENENNEFDDDIIYEEGGPRKRRKMSGRRYLKYSMEDREKAVGLVRAGLLTQQEASRRFNIPQGTLSDHVRAGQTIWKCSVCHKKFTNRAQSELHFMSHLDSRKLLCDICGFTTPDISSLKAHRSKKHPGEEETSTKPSVWNHKTTLLFLQIYEQCLNQVDEESTKKKFIWQMVADKLTDAGYGVTPRQCMCKWKTMLNGYHAYTRNSSDRRVFGYADEMAEFLLKNEGKYQDYEDVNAHSQEKTSWDVQGMSDLLSLYEARVDRFNDRLVKKKVLWKEIQQEMAKLGYGYSADQVMNKWKVLLRHYRLHKSNSMPEDNIKFLLLYARIGKLIDDNEENDAYNETDTSTQDGMSQDTIYPPESILLAGDNCPVTNNIKPEVVYTTGEELLTTEMSVDEKMQVVNVKKEEMEPAEEMEPEPILTEIIITPQENILEEIVTLPTTDVASTDSKVEWNETSISLLLEQYQLLLPKFRNPSVIKRPLWQKIHQTFLENGFKLSEQQIVNKWTVLKRLHKKGKESENPSEEKPAFMEKVAQLLDGDDNIDETEADESFEQEDILKTWTDESTSKFLDEYFLRAEKFEDDSVKKKQIWIEISDALQAAGLRISPLQCENKWKVVIKCYKRSKDANDENSSKDFLFCDKVEEILTKQEEIRRLMGKEPSEESENCCWDQISTQLLLEQYGKRLEKFNSDNIRRKEYLWQEISLVFKQNGYNFSVANVMNKWKSLLKSYRKVKDLLSSETVSLSKKQSKVDKFPYFVEVAQLLGGDMTVEVAQDSNSTEAASEHNLQSNNTDSVKNYSDVLRRFRKYESTQLQFMKQRSERLEEMHKEIIANLHSSPDIVAFLQDFEKQRQQFEQTQFEALQTMHKKSMASFRRLLKTVKQNSKN